jgi:hypothetical protein
MDWDAFQQVHVHSFSLADISKAAKAEFFRKIAFFKVKMWKVLVARGLT